MTLPVLFRKVSQSDRPPLPDSMDGTMADIISRGWSVNPASRGTFESIFDALRQIGFKLTPAVDGDRVAAFVGLVDPSAAVKPAKEFPPSMKKGKLRYSKGRETDKMYGIPDGIIAHLTRECRGNVHDRRVVEVTSGSFEKETVGANPHSGAFNNEKWAAAKNAADLDDSSWFGSAFRKKEEDIPHTRNNWVCYNFKERRIVPTHYTIRTNKYGWGYQHLKSWLIETSADGESWREVDHKENSEQLNGIWFTGTFGIADSGECRFIRLVNIGRNHFGNDSLYITAWEIFGSLVE